MGPVTPLLMEQVRFGYGSDAVLDGVSLRVEAGEGVALLGANGVGKTTLTRLAMALRHPQAGRVVTVGRDTARLQPEDLADAVGYLFQHPEAQLFASSVRREVAFGPARLGWAEDRIAGAVEAVLDECGLTAESERHPYDLPAPIRRVVALAAALVAGPSLLLLDEPTAGLDRANCARVLSTLAARRAAGVAIVAVTHDFGFAAELLDRAVVLDRGGVSHDGSLTALLGSRPEFPAPPLLALARGLGLADVRPTVAALVPRLTSRSGPRTLQA